MRFLDLIEEATPWYLFLKLSVSYRAGAYWA
jgi:hypothetical protein